MRSTYEQSKLKLDSLKRYVDNLDMLKALGITKQKKPPNLCLLSRTWKECTVKSQPPYFQSFASSEVKTITAKPSAL